MKTQPPKPQTVDEMYPSKWLKHEDLNGKAITLKVVKTDIELIHNTITKKDEYRAILDFGRSKRLVLNKTQCDQMAQITRSKLFEQWANVTITLTPTITRNGKKTIAIHAPSQPPAVDMPELETEDNPQVDDKE